MVSQSLFTLLVAAVATQRLFELRRSALHERRLRIDGAVEHAASQMRWMRLIHGAWLLSCIVEVWVAPRPFVPWLAIPAGGVFIGGQLLRRAAMRALGVRWSVRILVLPGAPPVIGGIFGRLRHPNYLGVILEIAALPLIHTAFLTALLFSTANGILLAFRIRAEEAALRATSSYAEQMADRSPLLPFGRRR